MRRFSAAIYAMTLLCTTMTTALAQATAPTNKEAAQQVLMADEARRVALLKSDFTALDSLLSDDATIIWGDGTADNKSSMVELLRSGKLRYAQLEYYDTRVRVYGVTAIVTGDGRVQAKSDQHAISYLVRVTRVYVLQDGRWRMVASQTTRVAPASLANEGQP